MEVDSPFSSTQACRTAAVWPSLIVGFPCRHLWLKQSEVALSLFDFGARVYACDVDFVLLGCI